MNPVRSRTRTYASAASNGVKNMYNVTIRTEFNSAHKLRGYKGKCESLHGHNWTIEVTVSAQRLNKLGMVIDFTDLKKGTLRFLEQLDHKYLNELKPFTKINPTSENISKFVYDGLKRICKRYKVKPVKVTVWETPTSSATYEPR